MQKVNHKKYKEECEKKFMKMTDNDIIDVFNKQVGNSGWTTSSGIYLFCLETEMRNRLFDLSAVFNKGLFFGKKIKLVKNVIVIDKI